MPGISGLGHDDVREALRLLGHSDPPGHRATALRDLREILTTYGAVRSALDRSPEGARAAFVRLAQDGPATVSDLLGRGWWGHGALPPPLDWLQRRALIMAADDGMVHVCDEARQGFFDLTLDLPMPPAEPEQEPLHVEEVGCIVVAATPSGLDRALTVETAALRIVAPTVAVSARSATAVTAALRGAGIRLDDDVAVHADPRTPALPGSGEGAVGPKAVRALLERAVDERRQLRLEYYASSRGGAATERVVCPWAFRDDLLRGYCHLRQDERTFAVDRIGHALLLPSAIDHTQPPEAGGPERGRVRPPLASK